MTLYCANAKFNAKFYMFLWAFFSWICAVNAFFAVFLIFSSPKDSLLVLLICSALAAPYFIFKHRRKKKEEAAQAAKNAPEGETTSAQA